jgi:hypothetical protein
MPPAKREPAQGESAPSAKKKARADVAADVPVPDAYLVKVHEALSQIMDHRTFQKIVDCKPLTIKPDGKKKGGGGFKVRGAGQSL